MPDRTYTEAVDAAYRRMTRGEADAAIYAAYLDGRTTAGEYIAHLREELHDAWRRETEWDFDRDHPGANVWGEED